MVSSRPSRPCADLVTTPVTTSKPSRAGVVTTVTTFRLRCAHVREQGARALLYTYRSSQVVTSSQAKRRKGFAVPTSAVEVGTGRHGAAERPNLNANLNGRGRGGSSWALGTAGYLARDFRAGFCSGFWFRGFRSGSRVFR